MTIIVWDGYMLAADKMTSTAGYGLTTTKLRRAPDGALLAHSGDALLGRARAAWWAAGADVTKYPLEAGSDTDFLVIKPDHTIWLYNNNVQPIPVEDKRFAMGSGRDYAYAAMHYGRDAAEGVRLASLYDLGCGNGVDVAHIVKQPGDTV